MLRRRQTAQVLLEFAYAMIVVMLMIYGAMMVFRWTGLDLAEKRIQHENLLTSDVGKRKYGSLVDSRPLQQIDPTFYKPIRMNAIWPGNK